MQAAKVKSDSATATRWNQVANPRKQQDVATFLKKRAIIEEEYGKQMIKLSQSMTEVYDKSHSKTRCVRGDSVLVDTGRYWLACWFSSTYGTVWTQFLKVHETIGDQRVKFSSDIAEVADDVQIMCKDTEKSRKQVKEIGIRHERNRLDAESSLEKVSLAQKGETEKAY